MSDDVRDWLEHARNKAGSGEFNTMLAHHEHRVMSQILIEILDLCEEPVVFRQTTLDGYGTYDTPATRERVRGIIERNIRAAEKA